MKTNWSDIYTRLSKELTQGELKVWIAPIEAVISHLNSEQVKVELFIKSKFALNQVKSKYSSLIHKVCHSAFQKEVELEFLLRKIDDLPFESKPMTSEELAQSLPTAPSVLAANRQLPLQLPYSTTIIEQNLKNFKHSFDTFVVGPCNNLAFAAAQNIILPDSDVDMLFLSSNPGLGKTHLSQALGRAIYTNSSSHNFNIAYLNANQFTSQFVQASFKNDILNFNKRFSSLDLLVLEDVHFLCKKGKTQEELLSIIKNLQDKGARVVFTSSLAPKDLKELDAQLISRFQSGFIATLQYPDFDTKKNMLMHKAHLKNFVLPEKVADIFAEELQGDVRLLESSLNNLFLHAKALNVPLTRELAYSIIAQVAPHNPDKNLEEILTLTCSCFELTAKQLASRTRRQDYVMARNTAFYLMRKHSSLTLEEIGQQLGKKHSTVSKAITFVESEISRKSNMGMKLLHSINAIEKRATFIG